MIGRVAGLVALIAVSCAPSGPAGSQWEVAPRAAPQRRPVAENSRPEADFVGIVYSPSSTTLSVEEAGSVTRVNVWPGKRLVQGEIVVELEFKGARREFQAVWRMRLNARALARSHQIELERSEAELGRLVLLERKGFASRAELESVGTQLEAARARVESAEEDDRVAATMLEFAQRRLDEAHVKSPCDCTVSAIIAQSGATVAAGTPLVRLVTDELWIRFAVPEGQVPTIHVGDVLNAESVALGSKLTATVASVSPELDGASRMFFVEAKIVSAPEHLASGMEIRVSARGDP